MTVAEIEDKILQTLKSLDCWGTIQSAGRNGVPQAIAYPACFVIWDGDKAEESYPRPVDNVDFKVIIQATNLVSEAQAATDIYELNDLVRQTLQGQRFGSGNIEGLACKSRRCTDYDDSDGMIEYTHLYSTRLYNPVPRG